LRNNRFTSFVAVLNFRAFTYNPQPVIRSLIPNCSKHQSGALSHFDVKRQIRNLKLGFDF
jgi:hypothetical protein